MASGSGSGTRIIGYGNGSGHGHGFGHEHEYEHGITQRKIDTLDYDHKMPETPSPFYLIDLDAHVYRPT
jgi:hypothetical protein